MAQNSSITKVTILGKEYSIKGEADPQYVQEVAKFVDETMQKICAVSQTASPSKVAILAALNIADELYREREEKENILLMAKKRISSLAESLEKVLVSENHLLRNNREKGDL